MPLGLVVGSFPRRLVERRTQRWCISRETSTVLFSTISGTPRRSSICLRRCRVRLLRSSVAAIRSWPSIGSEAVTGTPGHADEERDVEATRAAFLTRADKLPLGMLGPVVEIDTERTVDMASVASRVAEAARHA